MSDWWGIFDLAALLPRAHHKLIIYGLILLSTFMFVEFLMLAIDAFRVRRGGRARARLTDLATRLRSEQAADKTSILREEWGMTSGWSARLPLLEQLNLLLYRAGRPLRVPEFLWLSLALCLGGGFIGWVVLSDPRMAVALLASGLLPLLWVWRRKHARMRRFERMMPDALELLSRALRAGHAVTPSLQMVGDELSDPVGTEFALIAEEIRLGLDVPAALSNLAHRIDVPDLPFFVTALMIQRETGGNLAEIVDSLAAVIRERHGTEGKIKSLTAQTRWSANVLLLAPFAFVLMMKLMRPDYVAPLFETVPGRVIAGLATLMVLVGYALCRRLGVVRI